MPNGPNPLTSTSHSKRFEVGRAPTILVIDDDPAVQQTLELLLEDEGYQVVVACDGRKGIAAYAAVMPDLVITDIIMPETTGITVITGIKRINPDAQIIAISAAGYIGNTNFLELAKELGAATTITKPFDPEELFGAIRALLASELAVTASKAA